MSWRIVSISGTAKLDYKLDYLVVRNQERTKRIHLSEIAVLLLESTAISLTAYLLCELNRWKICVIFCDEKRCPYAVLSGLYGSHDTSLRYRQQIQWSEDAKKMIWTELVRAKIRGQQAVLPSQHEEARMLLQSYLEQLQPGDSTNREGHAAKVYFNALFGMAFSRSLDSPINAALNYGYGILLSVFAREIVSAGYNTQLGLFHNNMFNEFNLASDLMEPFRPMIDQTVLNMQPDKLEHEEKVQIVQTLNIRIRIDKKEQYMLNAIRIYTKSVFAALEERDISRLRFPCYE